MTAYPQLELDDQLCFALYTASRAIVRAYGPLLEGTGLTYPQYITLLVLWEDAQRPRTVGELGERLHLDSGTLTPLLKRLASAGYVTRSRDAADERRVLVSLTAEGLALRDRLATVPQSLFERCRELDVTAASSLRDQLVALTTALESSMRLTLVEQEHLAAGAQEGRHHGTWHPGRRQGSRLHPHVAGRRAGPAQ